MIHEQASTVRCLRITVIDNVHVLYLSPRLRASDFFPKLGILLFVCPLNAMRRQNVV